MTEWIKGSVFDCRIYKEKRGDDWCVVDLKFNPSLIDTEEPFPVALTSNELSKMITELVWILRDMNNDTMQSTSLETSHDAV